MKNQEFIPTPEEQNNLDREIMLKINQQMYDHGYLPYDIYRLAKERILTMKLD